MHGPSEDRILSGGSDLGIKVFKTLCESLAWWCSVGMFGKILSVLHWMEEEGSVCDTEEDHPFVRKSEKIGVTLF